MKGVKKASKSEAKKVMKKPNGVTIGKFKAMKIIVRAKGLKSSARNDGCVSYCCRHLDMTTRRDMILSTFQLSGPGSCFHS